jgi:hypothetical protein
MTDPKIKTRGSRLAVSRKKTIAGAVFPKYSGFLDKLNWNAKWMDEIRAAGDIPVFRYRENLYSFVNDQYFAGGKEPFDYVELGVYKGDSIRTWTRLNGHPESRLFGFDSFEGLPEDWLPGKPKGTFSTAGNVPDIADSRIQWFVGWFQHTMPGFLAAYEPKNKLLIHNDSDLFSSTLYSLSVMNPVIQPGTIVIFDEFDAVLDEYRALTEYASAFLRKFKLVGATENYIQAAVEIL